MGDERGREREGGQSGAGNGNRPAADRRYREGEQQGGKQASLRQIGLPGDGRGRRVFRPRRRGHHAFHEALNAEEKDAGAREDRRGGKPRAHTPLPIEAGRDALDGSEALEGSLLRPDSERSGGLLLLGDRSQVILDLDEDAAAPNGADAKLPVQCREIVADRPTTAHPASPTTAATAPENELHSLRPRSSLPCPRRVSL